MNLAFLFIHFPSMHDYESEVLSQPTRSLSTQCRLVLHMYYYILYWTVRSFHYDRRTIKYGSHTFQRPAGDIREYIHCSLHIQTETSEPQRERDRRHVYDIKCKSRVNITLCSIVHMLRTYVRSIKVRNICGTNSDSFIACHRNTYAKCMHAVQVLLSRLLHFPLTKIFCGLSVPRRLVNCACYIVKL